jgi:hypothetical protein
MLDWTEFCARFFPGRRERHDFEAAAAYGAYRRTGTAAERGDEPTPQGSVVGERVLASDESVMPCAERAHVLLRMLDAVGLTAKLGAFPFVNAAFSSQGRTLCQLS